MQLHVTAILSATSLQHLNCIHFIRFVIQGRAPSNVRQISTPTGNGVFCRRRFHQLIIEITRTVNIN